MNVCVIYNVFIIFINNNEKSKQIFFFSWKEWNFLKQRYEQQG